MFQWMGYSFLLIDAEYINDRTLKDFEILRIPGGDMYQYAQDISPEGKENIRNFVSSGGGHVGMNKIPYI
jgi:glutamine amidotransferase-like uncharacterized protein